MGPDTYDLASLLRDRGVARILGEETELELVDYYAEWRVHGLPARIRASAGRAAIDAPPLFRDPPAALHQDPRHVLQAAAHARPHVVPRLHPADAGERPSLHRRAARIRPARRAAADGLLLSRGA